MSYFRQEHGITLQDYRVDYPWWEWGENRYLDNWHACGFREFDGPPRSGDMAIMQVSAPVANHASILLADGLLLHHSTVCLASGCLTVGIGKSER